MNEQIGLCLIQMPYEAEELDLQIEYIPSAVLFNYLQKEFSLKSKGREDERKAIANKIKQLVHGFVHDRSLLEDVHALREQYVTAVGSLAFVAPELNLIDETRKARESFLEKTAREFLVKDSKDRPNALTIYFASPPNQESIDDHDKLIKLPDGTLIEAAEEIVLSDSERLIERASHGLRKHVKKSSVQAYRDLQAQRKNKGVQLRLLSSLVTVKMLAVEFRNLGFEEMLEFYQDVARGEGDYYFQVPGFVARSEEG